MANRQGKLSKNGKKSRKCKDLDNSKYNNNHVAVIPTVTVTVTLEPNLPKELFLEIINCVEIVGEMTVKNLFGLKRLVTQSQPYFVELRDILEQIYDNKGPGVTLESMCLVSKLFNQHLRGLRIALKRYYSHTFPYSSERSFKVKCSHCPRYFHGKDYVINGLADIIIGEKRHNEKCFKCFGIDIRPPFGGNFNSCSNPDCKALFYIRKASDCKTVLYARGDSGWKYCPHCR